MKKSKCGIKVTYFCDTLNQKSCEYFRQSEDCPSTLCKYGLTERECRNKAAQEFATGVWMPKDNIRVRNK